LVDAIENTEATEPAPEVSETEPGVIRRRRNKLVDAIENTEATEPAPEVSETEPETPTEPSED
jgi:hypothetical protein